MHVLLQIFSMDDIVVYWCSSSCDTSCDTSGISVLSMILGVVQNTNDVGTIEVTSNGVSQKGFRLPFRAAHSENLFF